MYYTAHRNVNRAPGPVPRGMLLAAQSYTLQSTVVRTYFVIGVFGLLSQSEALLPAGRLCLRRQIALLGLCVRHPRIELGLLARPLLVPLLPPASRLPR